MSKVRFILDNAAIDSATLSTDISVDTEYPVENIKKIARSKPLRSIDTSTSLDIRGTLNSEVDISALVLGRHNFTDLITYQLFLYSDNNWNVLEYDSTELTVDSGQAAVSGLYEWGEFAWGTIAWGADKEEVDTRKFYDVVLWLDDLYENIQSFIIRLNVVGAGPYNPFYCDEASIRCDDASITCDQLGFGTTPGGASGIPYYEIGKVYLGEYIEPLYNISAGHNISWVENTTQYRPSSGTLRSDIVTSNKAFEFSLVTIPESDRITLHKQLIAKGLKDDFYISMFPNDSSPDKEIDYSGMVKVAKIPKYVNYISDYYKSKFVMEEV